jgi:hypothetical protein
MTERPTMQEKPLRAIFVPQLAWVRWCLLGTAWACLAAALPLTTVDRNRFIYMQTEGETSGMGFHRWVLGDLPGWEISRLLRGDFGHTQVLDIVWLVAAIVAILLFVLSPLIFARVRRPETLLILRYVGLALLVLPVTLFLPATLSYPQPRIGMYFLAAAHALVLVGLWSPWPVLRAMKNSFEVTLTGEAGGGVEQ